MRFSEFLRTTVLISAASASLLAVLTVIGANGAGDTRVLEIGAGWWLVSAVIGAGLGRRPSTSGPIAALLANARTRPALPEMNPSRTVLNRLWPTAAVHDRGRRGGLRRAPGPGDRRWFRDHLGAGLASAVSGGDRDRGA